LYSTAQLGVARVLGKTEEQRPDEGDPGLDDQLIDGMKRELVRARGFLEWKPAR
jgi:hypothetical protein